ncbi:MAG: hypothetical protein FGF48_00545 [Candidatus Brockarchaeota archaeon]|nr:hypothetical protein [Candidatus Brockarchaeota archaeon]
MCKKRLWIVATILLLATIVPLGAIFLPYPYSPIRPPQANDAGSAPQGVQEVVKANKPIHIQALL